MSFLITRERDAALLCTISPKQKSSYPALLEHHADETRDDDSDVNDQRAKEDVEILSLSLLCVILFARDFVRENLDAAAL